MILNRKFSPSKVSSERFIIDLVSSLKILFIYKIDFNGLGLTPQSFPEGLQPVYYFFRN